MVSFMYAIRLAAKYATYLDGFKYTNWIIQSETGVDPRNASPTNFAYTVVTSYLFYDVTRDSILGMQAPQASLVR